MARKKLSMDGNTAAAHVSYAFTEVATIYPITPASPMAEHVDTWAANGKKNLIRQFISKSKNVFETDHLLDTSTGSSFAFLVKNPDYHIGNVFGVTVCCSILLGFLESLLLLFPRLL